MVVERPKALYSGQAALLWGTVFWKNAKGDMFEITAWCIPSEYKWEDAVVVTEDELVYSHGATYERF